MGRYPSASYGSEPRRARRSACLTQEQLAERIQYSASMVAMVESARRAPSLDFSRRCDNVLETGGLLARIVEFLITKDVTPEWFRPWVLVTDQALGTEHGHGHGRAGTPLPGRRPGSDAGADRAPGGQREQGAADTDRPGWRTHLSPSQRPVRHRDL